MQLCQSTQKTFGLFSVLPSSIFLVYSIVICSIDGFMEDLTYLKNDTLITTR